MPQTESPRIEPTREDESEDQIAQQQARIQRTQQSLAERENQFAILEAEVERLRAEHRQALLRKDERIRALEDQVSELTTILAALRQPIVTGPPQYQHGQG